MAKKQDEVSAYWNALTQLIAIIKTEYSMGGKLPPATEMSERLHVSRVTYGKALKTVCTHGLASASQGRRGSVVEPFQRNRQKIGIFIFNGQECPFMTHASELGTLMTKFSEKNFPQQFIQCQIPEKLYEKLIIYNISLLLCINPAMEIIPILGRIQKKYHFPILISCFTGYHQEAACRKEGLFIIQHDLRAEAHKIVEFLIAKNTKNLLLLDQKFGYVDRALNVNLSKYGISLPPENCVPTNKLESDLLKTIRKRKIDVMMLEGGPRIYRVVFELLKHLPKYRRPAVLLRGEISDDILSDWRNAYPDIRILGLMVYQTEKIGEHISEVVSNHILSGKPLETRLIDNFIIKS